MEMSAKPLTAGRIEGLAARCASKPPTSRKQDPKCTVCSGRYNISDRYLTPGEVHCTVCCPSRGGSTAYCVACDARLAAFDESYATRGGSARPAKVGRVGNAGDVAAAIEDADAASAANGAPAAATAAAIPAAAPGVEGVGGAGSGGGAAAMLIVAPGGDEPDGVADAGHAAQLGVPMDAEDVLVPGGGAGAGAHGGAGAGAGVDDEAAHVAPAAPPLAPSPASWYDTKEEVRIHLQTATRCVHVGEGYKLVVSPALLPDGAPDDTRGWVLQLCMLREMAVPVGDKDGTHGLWMIACTCNPTLDRSNREPWIVGATAEPMPPCAHTRCLLDEEVKCHIDKLTVSADIASLTVDAAQSSSASKSSGTFYVELPITASQPRGTLFYVCVPDGQDGGTALASAAIVCKKSNKLHCREPECDGLQRCAHRLTLKREYRRPVSTSVAHAQEQIDDDLSAAGQRSVSFRPRRLTMEGEIENPNAKAGFDKQHMLVRDTWVHGIATVLTPTPVCFCAAKPLEHCKRCRTHCHCEKCTTKFGEKGGTWNTAEESWELAEDNARVATAGKMWGGRKVYQLVCESGSGRLPYDGMEDGLFNVNNKLLISRDVFEMFIWAFKSNNSMGFRAFTDTLWHTRTYLHYPATLASIDPALAYLPRRHFAGAWWTFIQLISDIDTSGKCPHCGDHPWALIIDGVTWGVLWRLFDAATLDRPPAETVTAEVPTEYMVFFPRGGEEYVKMRKLLAEFGCSYRGGKPEKGLKAEQLTELVVGAAMASLQGAEPGPSLRQLLRNKKADAAAVSRIVLSALYAVSGLTPEDRLAVWQHPDFGTSILDMAAGEYARRREVVNPPTSVEEKATFEINKAKRLAAMQSLLGEAWVEKPMVPAWLQQAEGQPLWLSEVERWCIIFDVLMWCMTMDVPVSVSADGRVIKYSAPTELQGVVLLLSTTASAPGVTPYPASTAHLLGVLAAAEPATPVWNALCHHLADVSPALYKLLYARAGVGFGPTAGAAVIKPALAGLSRLAAAYSARVALQQHGPAVADAKVLPTTQYGDRLRGGMYPACNRLSWSHSKVYGRQQAPTTDPEPAEGESCTKNKVGSSGHSPGYLGFFCPHGYLLALQYHSKHESVAVVFNVLFERFTHGHTPSLIVYDNACNLQKYCMTHEPKAFMHMRFVSDRLHLSNHTDCSSCVHKLPDTGPMSRVNSQAAEQAWSKVSSVSRLVGFMRLTHAVHHTTIYHVMRNKDKCASAGSNIDPIKQAYDKPLAWHNTAPPPAALASLLPLARWYVAQAVEKMVQLQWLVGSAGDVPGFKERVIIAAKQIINSLDAVKDSHIGITVTLDHLRTQQHADQPVEATVAGLLSRVAALSTVLTVRSPLSQAPAGGAGAGAAAAPQLHPPSRPATHTNVRNLLAHYSGTVGRTSVSQVHKDLWNCVQARKVIHIAQAMSAVGL